MHFYQDENFHIYCKEKLITDKSDSPIFSVDICNKYHCIYDVYSVLDNILYHTEYNKNTDRCGVESIPIEPGYIGLACSIVIYPNYFIDIHDVNNKYYHDNIVKIYKRLISFGIFYVLDTKNILTRYESSYGFTKYIQNGHMTFPYKILYIGNKIHYVDDDGIKSIDFTVRKVKGSLDNFMTTDDKIIFRSNAYLIDNLFYFGEDEFEILGYTLNDHNIIIVTTNEEYYSCIFGEEVRQLIIVPYIATWISTCQMKSARNYFDSNNHM